MRFTRWVGRGPCSLLLRWSSKMRIEAIIALTFCFTAALTEGAFFPRRMTLQEQPRPTFEDAIQVTSFGDLTISSDGSRVLYRASRPDLRTNTSVQTTWLQSLAGPAQREDMSAFLAGASRFQWGRTPQSGRLYFIRDGKLFETSLHSGR